MIREDLIQKSVLSRFFFTNMSKLPEFLFEGNCFSGVDYISGQAGAQEYEHRIGTKLQPGEDGAYVMLRKIAANTWCAGSDFNGYCHIYYYQHGEAWVISTSFLDILQYLKKKGLPYSTNYSQLSSWRSDPYLVRTPMSLRSAVNEVSLLPSGYHLEISSGNLVCKKNDLREQDSLPYQVQLTRFVDTWRSRYATLMLNSKWPFIAHLTGGLDSRIIFALVKSVIEALGPKARENTKIFSTSKNLKDFEVATRICKTYGIELNRTMKPQSRPDRLTAEERYHFWRRAHLGSYSHLVFPLVAPGHSANIAPGLGGECNRKVYRPPLNCSMEQIARFRKRKWQDKELHRQWSESLAEADELLMKGPTASRFAMVRNHREFRDRFHSGHNVFWNTNCISLSSRSMYMASNQLGAASFARGQALFDVLFGLDSELAKMPYDSWFKKPSRSIVKNLTSIKFSDELNIGSCFEEQAPEKSSQKVEPWGNPLELFFGDVEISYRNSSVTDFLGLRYCDQAVRVLRKDLDKGTQNAHERGRGGHAMLLANLLL